MINPEVKLSHTQGTQHEQVGHYELVSQECNFVVNTELS